MTTAIVEVQNAVAEFDKVAAGIEALQKQYGGVVYDVKTTQGMDDAKAARAAVREPRYEIERVRKDAKAPILKLGRELDSRANAITAQIMAIEGPIDTQIKNEEARKEREKQEKIAAEIKRRADLEERVAELRGNQMISSLSDPCLIIEHIQDLEKIVVDESFQELQQQAADAKSAGLARLYDMHGAAIARVAEQERIKQERAELEKLRAEQAKRDADDRARIAEDERKAKEARDAEAAKQAAELKQWRDEQAALAAAERKRIADEEAAAKAIRDAEAKKLADERAEFERQQAEAKRLRDAEEAAKREQARLASIQRPSNKEIVAVLANHYNVPTKMVEDWLSI